MSFEYFIGTLVQLLVFSSVPFFWWLQSAAEKESFFHWIGLRKIRLTIHPMKFLGISSIAILIYGILMNLFIQNMLGENLNATYEFADQGWKAFLKILAYAIIRTALSEELFFRGFLLKRIDNRFGFRTANIIQSLVFGSLHGIPFCFLTQNIGVLIIFTLLPSAMGWFEGYVNEKYCGGSIITSWCMHALMNILSGISAAF